LPAVGHAHRVNAKDRKTTADRPNRQGKSLVKVARRQLFARVRPGGMALLSLLTPR
jgi:hypothetical protein